MCLPNQGPGQMTFKVLSNIACRLWALFVISPHWTSFVKLANQYANKSNDVARREIFICPKLGENLSEIEVRTFGRLQIVIFVIICWLLRLKLSRTAKFILVFMPNATRSIVMHLLCFLFCFFSISFSFLARGGIFFV